jgi:hypothetical protein
VSRDIVADAETVASATDRSLPATNQHSLLSFGQFCPTAQQICVELVEATGALRPVSNPIVCRFAVAQLVIDWRSEMKRSVK